MNSTSLSALVLTILMTGAMLVGSPQPSAAAEHLVGGYSATSTTNAEVIAAAEFAVSAQSAVEKKGIITLVELLAAEQQVVAGMNYRLHLRAKVNGLERKAEAVVWRRLSGEQELTSWTWQ